jgi:hypothetical protein
MRPSPRPSLLAAAVVVAALAAVQADAAPATLSYHGSIRIDYRYTSGGALTPGSAPDIEQTAHLTLTVNGNRITHLHGVVGFDYKQYYQLCPNVLVEATGGGTVDAKPDLGGSYAVLDSNWHPKGRYVTPEPAVPPAKVTSHTVKPDQSCNSVSQTDRATFQLTTCRFCLVTRERRGASPAASPARTRAPTAIRFLHFRHPRRKASAARAIALDAGQGPLRYAQQSIVFPIFDRAQPRASSCCSSR